MCFFFKRHILLQDFDQIQFFLIHTNLYDSFFQTDKNGLNSFTQYFDCTHYKSPRSVFLNPYNTFVLYNQYFNFDCFYDKPFAKGATLDSITSTPFAFSRCICPNSWFPREEKTQLLVFPIAS